MFKFALSLFVTGVLNGCATPPTLSPAEQQAAVFSYLDCDECFNGQYRYVTSLGFQVKDDLDDAKNGTGVYGERLAQRRLAYFEEAKKIVQRQLGIFENTSAVIDRANELADAFIAGDKKRHKARAKRALENLSNAKALIWCPDQNVYRRKC